MLRDDETSCAIVDEESGTSELLPPLIKHHTSIAVKLKRLLIMWLTSVMLTPFLLYCIVTTVESASIILLIDDNGTLYDNSTDSWVLEDTSALVDEDENVTASALDTTSQLVTSLASSVSPSTRPFNRHPPASVNPSKTGTLPLPMSSRGKSKSKIDCMIDPAKGFTNPTNVYQCHVTQKCCLEYAKPSCCGSKSTTQIM